MKPSLWITACCFNLVLVPALADEPANTPPRDPQAAPVDPQHTQAGQANAPAPMPSDQAPCAEWHRAQHQHDHSYYPPHRYQGQGHPAARGAAQGYPPQPYARMNPMQTPGEAPAYRNEGAYGYGYTAPGGYPSPHAYGSPRYNYAPPTGYQGQGYDSHGMGHGYGAPPAYNYENPPVPGYGYDDPSAPGGEGYAYPGYRAAPPAAPHYPSAYQTPRAYAAPYGDPAQRPFPHDPGIESNGFGAEPMAPDYPYPPVDHRMPPAHGYQHAPGAGLDIPTEYAPSPQAELPTPSMERTGAVPAAIEEQAPESSETAVQQPEAAAPEPPPAPQAETEEEKQEG